MVRLGRDDHFATLGVGTSTGKRYRTQRPAQRSNTCPVATATMQDGRRLELYDEETSTGGQGVTLREIAADGPDLGDNGGCGPQTGEVWTAGFEVFPVDDPADGVIAIAGRTSADTDTVTMRGSGGQVRTIDVTTDGYYIDYFEGDPEEWPLLVTPNN